MNKRENKQTNRYLPNKKIKDNKWHNKTVILQFCRFKITYEYINI